LIELELCIANAANTIRDFKNQKQGDLYFIVFDWYLKLISL